MQENFRLNRGLAFVLKRRTSNEQRGGGEEKKRSKKIEKGRGKEGSRVRKEKEQKERNQSVFFGLFYFWQ